MATEKKQIGTLDSGESLMLPGEVRRPTLRVTFEMMQHHLKLDVEDALRPHFECHDVSVIPGPGEALPAEGMAFTLTIRNVSNEARRFVASLWQLPEEASES